MHLSQLEHQGSQLWKWWLNIEEIYNRQKQVNMRKGIQLKKTKKTKASLENY